jgi:hypothetical protein
MMRNFSLLFLLIFCCNCHSKKTSAPTTAKPLSHDKMDYFELSYRGGWEGGLSFCVDSSKIFFFPQMAQSVEGSVTKYGLLPDSLFDHINSLIPRLRQIPSQKPDSLYCYDCPEISIRAVNGADTLRLFLAGDADTSIWLLIERLADYERNSKLQKLTTAYFFLETMSDVVHMPPKIIK